MSHIDTGGKGGRKSTVELNLVPFIDLMSVLITFLLLTAVWNQVTMIQLGASLYAKKSEDTPVPEIPKEADVVLKLDITTKGYSLLYKKDQFNFPLISGAYDEEGLAKKLDQVRANHPEKKDAVIAMSDDLPYERMITGMDQMLKKGYENLSIATGGSNAGVGGN